MRTNKSLITCEDCYSYTGVRCENKHPDDRRGVHRPESSPCFNFRNNTHQPLLPLKRMAHLLSVEIKWLQGMAESGEVPALKAGTGKNRWLFSVDAVIKRLLVLASRPTRLNREDRVAIAIKPSRYT